MKRLAGEAGIIVIYVLLAVVSGALIYVGLQDMQSDAAQQDRFLAGILCAVFSVGMLPVALALANPRRGGGGPQHHRDHELLRAQSELLRQIHEHTMLSDAAKRIAYRRKEREMLRNAIEEDIAHEDWQAAMVLVDDMANQFGYREEAEEFREVIRQRRHDVLARRLEDALAHFDELVMKRQWAEAYAEAGRLHRLYPEARQVKDLEARVREHWEDHKHALERQFLDAAGRADVTQAMELIKQLDVYLTPREAEPYREVARGVISKARDNLGLRFKLAVQDRDWNTAIRVGDQIINDFPNTQMAREVREHIDRLRLLAAQAAHAAAATAGTPGSTPGAGSTGPGSPATGRPGNGQPPMALSRAAGLHRPAESAAGTANADIEDAVASLEAAYGEKPSPLQSPKE